MRKEQKPFALMVNCRLCALGIGWNSGGERKKKKKTCFRNIEFKRNANDLKNYVDSGASVKSVVFGGEIGPQCFSIPQFRLFFIPKN